MRYSVREIEKNGPEIYRFRSKVILQDCGFPESALHSNKNHSDFIEEYKSPMSEDAYKFSEKKWKQTEFDLIFGAEVDGEIVSISGARLYKQKHLRIGMHYYTLKSYRPRLRFPLWVQGGFADLSISRFHNIAQSAFLTVYEHNSRLKALGRRLRSNHRGHLSQTLPSATHMMKKFAGHPEQIKFNNVSQVLFYYPLVDGFNVYDLIEDIT